MAEVFRTTDPLPAPGLAIKLIRPEHAERVTSLKRFELESAIACRSTHPNLVRGIAPGKCEGRPFLLMEYVPGVTASEALSAGPLPPGHARRVVADIAAALEYLHREHDVIAHRDIKPQNVILSTAGSAVLLDAGIALTPKSRGWTAAGSLVGSPHYLAPEQWSSPDDAGRTVDIYALGALFYELLTATKLFGGATTREVRDGHWDAPAKRRMLTDVRVRRWRDLIDRSTAVDPQRRPRDAGAFARELDQASIWSPLSRWPRGTVGRDRPTLGREAAAHGR